MAWSEHSLAINEAALLDRPGAERRDRARACLAQVHLDDKASISQREVGADTVTYLAGLHAVVRQDADGEHRDSPERSKPC